MRGRLGARAQQRVFSRGEEMDQRIPLLPAKSFRTSCRPRAHLEGGLFPFRRHADRASAQAELLAAAGLASEHGTQEAEAVLPAEKGPVLYSLSERASAAGVMPNAGLAGERQTKKTCRGRLAPLHVAVMEGCEATVTLLLEDGADLEEEDEDGHTPVMIAAWAGHAAVARLLLEHGASSSATNVDGDTPLHIAVRGRHHQAARVLLKAMSRKGDGEERQESAFFGVGRGHCSGRGRGINSKGKSNSDCSVGMRTTSNTSSSTGATPTVPGRRRNFMAALTKGILTWKTTFSTTGGSISGAGNPRRRDNDVVAWKDCSEQDQTNGDEDRLKASFMHSKTNGPDTALQSSGQVKLSYYESLAIVEGSEAETLLLSRSNSKNESREGMIQYAGEEESFVAAVSDQEHVETVNLTNKAGAAPLHIAAAMGESGMVSLLLEEGSGVDVNTRHAITGMTALNMATHFGHPGAAKVLLRHGAQANVGGFKGFAGLEPAITE